MNEIKSWLTKTEAMTELNRSERSLARLQEQGKLRIKEDPEDPRRNLYSAADVARILTKRDSGEEEIESELPRRHVVVKGAGSGSTQNLVRALLATVVQQQSKQIAPPAPKLWMRLEEAEAYSGLPRRIILKAVKANEITGIQAGAWLVQKAALDRFSGMV